MVWGSMFDGARYSAKGVAPLVLHIAWQSVIHCDEIVRACMLYSLYDFILGFSYCISVRVVGLIMIVSDVRGSSPWVCSVYL